MIASIEEVIQFLKDYKLVMTISGLNVLNRMDDKNSLIKLGITKKIRKQEILSLSLTNYCEGPNPDHSRDGYVWIFGKKLEGIEVYIKLKLVELDTGMMAKCISFHEADHPLSYPYSQIENKE